MGLGLGLGVSGDGKIDAAFIQSEEHYSSATDDVSLPVIDLQNSSPQEVEKACRDWGFFHLINHGVPTHVLHRLESAAADFFALPLQEKIKVSRDAENPFGYCDFEVTRNVRDWKEVFDFVPRETIQFPASSNPDDCATVTFKNQWLNHHPNFREACLAYADAAREVSFKLIQLIARSLGVADNRFNEYFRDDMSRIRLNCYPECPAPELALGLACHRDGDALTLVYQDQVGGLQVKRKDNGHWLPVHPLPDSFVVNVGDCVQVWSNDRYESVEHRVAVNDTRRRLSVAFFFNPSQGVIVKPLDELVSDEDPPKFKEYNFGKLNKRRRDSHSKNLGVENLQVSQFKV